MYCCQVVNDALWRNYVVQINSFKVVHNGVYCNCAGVRNYNASEMRYNAEHELHGGEYRFADSIVLASGYVERY